MYFLGLGKIYASALKALFDVEDVWFSFLLSSLQFMFFLFFFFQNFYIFLMYFGTLDRHYKNMNIIVLVLVLMNNKQQQLCSMYIY